MKAASPVKVALILRHFHPIVTGPAVRHRQIAERIHAFGFRMEFHTLLPENTDLPKIEKCECYDVIRHNLSTNSEIKEQSLDAAIFRTARNYWVKTQEFPKIIVGFSTTRKLLPHLLWARRSQIKLVLSLTIAPEIQGLSLLSKSWMSISQYFMLKRFDALCALSTTLGEHYVRLGARPQTLHVFPFPVNVERFKPSLSCEEKTKLRLKVGLPLDHKLILFSGGIIKRKGVDLLLSAWQFVTQRHPEAKLVLVGEKIRKSTATSSLAVQAEDAFHKELQALIEKGQIVESIVFVGQVSNPEDYCGACDIFVFPSRLEGMGGVVPEAMASGLPCIITPFIGFPEREFGTEGIHYLRAELCPSSIADSICRLLEDSALSKSLGDSARQWALDEFDLQVITKRMAHLYQSLISETRVGVS